MCETFKSRWSCCSKLKDRSNDESIYLVLGPQSMAGAITNCARTLMLAFMLCSEKNHTENARERISQFSQRRESVRARETCVLQDFLADLPSDILRVHKLRTCFENFRGKFPFTCSPSSSPFLYSTYLSLECLVFPSPLLFLSFAFYLISNASLSYYWPRYLSTTPY